MIYRVTEWYDNSAVSFYFDSSKVNKDNEFETSYLRILELAANKKNAWIDLSRHMDKQLIDSIEERFGTYQEGTDCWKNLLAQLPCMVDKDVNIVMSS